MEKNITIDKTQQIILPYDENMNITIVSEGIDNFDVTSLKNYYTDNYECIKITKKLKQNNLTIRSFKPYNQSINIIYKNNGRKGPLKVNNEDIDINLDDTVITLTIDEDINTSIHIVSNDMLITETIVEEETETNKEETKKNISLKEEYDKLLKQNEKLVTKNKELIEKIQKLDSDNEKLSNQNKTYTENIQELEDTFKENNDNNKRLQKEFDAALNHYHITKEIFEEYKNEDKSKDVKDKLEQIKKELDDVENMLKQYITSRQKTIQTIREKVKPQ
ncbi:MAG: hypothetical protein LUH02_09635 [Erysipelotrichaceae bacterium]|nr:hypothetical protein [Erysipelotrichaceae bacterium]